MSDGEIDYRIYEFYVHQFSGFRTYSSHSWSGYIRMKYGTGIKDKMFKILYKIWFGYDVFDKGSI